MSAVFSHPIGPYGRSWGETLSETPLTDAPDQLSPEQRRLTKMTCTMGPASWTPDGISKLIDAGMTTLRLNFSHGDHTSHKRTLDNLTAALADRDHAALEQVAVMLDTKGPEIRTGMLENGSSVKLQRGQRLELTTDYSFMGTEEKIACSYADLPKSVAVGSTILVADGVLALRVVEVLEESVVCIVENNAEIGERKNMNLPGAKISLPVLTEKDVGDVVSFGIPNEVDYIAASFVRTVEDVQYIREVLDNNGGQQIQIIAKIENQEGLENYAEILAEVDGIMLARGDLGMELPPEKLFLATKWMLELAARAGKPTIMATQMLESMTASPRPTRAECIDVAQAVLDGSHCTMLSGETAKGSFPYIAARTMARIASEAERAFLLQRKPWEYNGSRHAITAAELCRAANASLMVLLCPTTSPEDEAALKALITGLACLYLTCPCVVPTSCKRLARCISGMYRGIVGHHIDEPALAKSCPEWSPLQRAGLVSSQDTVVVLSGPNVKELVLRTEVLG